MKSLLSIFITLIGTQLFLASTATVGFTDGFPTSVPTSIPTSVPTTLPTSVSTSAPAAGDAGGIGGAMKAQAEKLKVNINTAPTADLAKLPGIGATKADAIVAGRPYNQPSDIMKVKGIKQGVFNKIKGMITTK